MVVEILDAKSQKPLATLTSVTPASTILDVKKEYRKIKTSLYPERQSYRLEPRGRSLKDEDTLSSLGLGAKGVLYFKDLGPQVGWTTVFLTEYAGPLLIYPIFYIRPSCIYGAGATSEPYAKAVHIALACWTFHYAKRLLETVFVHRFSHATMPIMNIFKNSLYYWGFTAFVSYFINHPLYTPPAYGNVQLYGGLALFVVAELGNLSIHIALKNLRPPGTKLRRILNPTSNPLTCLASLVSCPNYTYEALAWIGFSVLSQSLPAALFTAAGFYQMSIWALGKLRNYRREFKEYPRSRKAILPFIL
ncbi:probable very-long-chain enoyl-CoA reductase art-1 [Liolophura sinensis]|uniref:probable very-long-chain enoyl-CoA reductase art-1 n=1 Tax=Liolophura sinensis TaxID=3198878 RepID=UPI0031594D12